MDERYETLVNAVQDSMIKDKWSIFECDPNKEKRITILDSNSATIIRESTWGEDKPTMYKAGGGIGYNFGGLRR